MVALARKLAADPVAAAHHAGLRHVSDTRPGIRRMRRGRSFAYISPEGRLIRNAETLGRIRRLAIPPAWTEVWISPVENGHMQATGRDDRGRKQYRYHPAWQRTRTATKFHRLLSFGRALAAIRRTVGRHLRLKGLPREKVLATVVRLLETTRIRVGNDEYADGNNSFGLTTLRDGHARISRSQLRFRFPGKSGKVHEVRVDDPRLARIVRRCQELPGQELLQYVDESGQVRDIDSADVNDYLREITGEDFTAKDFRTWAGTVLFVDALRRIDPCRSKSHAKRTLVRLVQDVAEALGNTPTVCRKYYIHPFAIDSLLNISIHETLERVCEAARGNGRLSTEALLMKLLARLSLESVATAAAALEPQKRPPLVSPVRSRRSPGTRKTAAGKAGRNGMAAADRGS